MITNNLLNIGGRLGNQMFQYATLLGIKHKKGYDIVLDKENLYDSMLTNTFNLKQCSIIEKSDVLFDSTYCENCHCFDPNVLEVDDDTNLRGYFQTEKYFEHCRDVVKKEFSFNEQIQKEVDDFLNPYKDHNLVSVHVRRTDYLVYTNIHSKCDMFYYEQAFDRLNKPETTFVVVSDDIAWCKENFKMDNVVYSSGAYDFDLCLQSKCNHHIISNSTFSWWGAWLGKNSNKEIIAPENWFDVEYAKNLPDYDIVPKNWIKIKNIKQ